MTALLTSNNNMHNGKDRYKQEVVGKYPIL